VIGARLGFDSYGRTRSRLGGFPDVLGHLPASLLPSEIETPGERQIRALFVSPGNPVLSVPGEHALVRALRGLDLLVSLDLYANETGRHADYVLPTTTFLEREDLPVAPLGFFTTPFIQVTDAVVDPPGEARQERQIVDATARRIGLAPYSARGLRRLARLGVRPGPRPLVDSLLRIGPRGDLFGLRPSALSWERLRRRTRDRARRAHRHRGTAKEGPASQRAAAARSVADFAAELERAASVEGEDAAYPLRLIGLRELGSHNSWRHSAPLLMRGGRTQTLRVHPHDAATRVW
jgi:anaerobic selenocysteine-containing dehydrogenase